MMVQHTIAHVPSRGITLTTMVVVLTVLAALVGGVAYFATLQDPTEVAGPILEKVKRATFRYDVIERGEVESSRNVEIRCEVKARGSAGTAIIEVVEEGTDVENGDFLVHLDSSAFEEELVQQQIICNTSLAQVVSTQNNHQSALIAKKEYENGTYKEEMQEIQSDIFVAEENLRRARQYARYSERLAAKGYVTALQLEGDRFAEEKARNELESGKTRLNVLRQYTSEKMKVELDSDIETTKATWESAKKSHVLDNKKLEEVKQQIEKCVISAPQSGQVVYANKKNRHGNEFVVEAGAMVRERQVIIRLPDPSQMQVRCKINESRITLVRPEMDATIKLDAYNDLILSGRVRRVNEYPEPSHWFSGHIKYYATVIEIDKSPQGIRPGLTAEVQVHVQEIEDVLQVPVQAIHSHGNRHLCVVKKDGRWTGRDVQITASNEKFAVVESGLLENEQVVLDPASLIHRLDLIPELIPGKKGTDVVKESSPGHDDRAQSVDGRDRLSATELALSKKQTEQAGVDEMSFSKQSDSNIPGGPQSNPVNTGSSDVSTLVTHVMSRWDKNGDDSLSSEELSADQLEQFSAADRNGDGHFDRAELTAALARRLSTKKSDNN